jgi:hypothetical protein
MFVPAHQKHIHLPCHENWNKLFYFCCPTNTTISIFTHQFSIVYCWNLLISLFILFICKLLINKPCHWMARVLRRSLTLLFVINIHPGASTIFSKRKFDLLPGFANVLTQFCVFNKNDVLFPMWNRIAKLSLSCVTRRSRKKIIRDNSSLSEHPGTVVEDFRKRVTYEHRLFQLTPLVCSPFTSTFTVEAIGWIFFAQEVETLIALALLQASTFHLFSYK